MDRVTIDLENCYGIKKLRHTLDFSNNRAYGIYAPNGMMKSSLALAFADISEGKASMDRIFPSRTTKREITDENGAPLAKESVFAVRPYNEEFGPNEKTALLLVDAKLRKEYEQLYAGIDNAKDALLKGIREQAHSKRDFEHEIASAFTPDSDFYKALTRIKTEVAEEKESVFADVVYDKIFDDKVLNVLGKKDVRTAIDNYVKRYNELLAASVFFKKGTFDYYNAGRIAKSLADNCFFAAKHTVKLKSEMQDIEINTQKELESVIAKEKDEILKDKQLRKQFDELATMLDKNETLRDFQAYVMDHEALVARLANIDKFREDVLKSYLRARIDLYQDLMSKYEAAAARKKQIEEEAAKQRTTWEEVIRIFNDRFFVPFTLEATNRLAVVLGDEGVITLGFTYHDGKDSATIEKTALLEALSTGEKKALYILNIIFAVEVRKKENRETLMIIDDIADSFDYQNKYAIIQYLSEIKRDPLFKQIIMTHNFDFFRTISRRFVGYGHCLMAMKTPDGITLVKAAGIQNVFVNDWKKEFFTNTKKKIASIPFMRNLLEYMKGEDDPEYKKLTSLLHWKSDSLSITEKQIDDIYRQMFTVSTASANGKRPMLDVIRDEAKSCVSAGVGINLENKIVLAMAIRLRAEEFMIGKISDPAFVAGIEENQTNALVAKFREKFPGENKAIEVLDRVVLMTPENIHLNSFMYEPIIDMADSHLRTLYTDVSALK